MREWVLCLGYVRDETIQYPEKNPLLGRYLGPAIDVGPAMTTNTMKGNGEVLHWSTYRGLKEEETTNQSHILSRKDFDSNIKDRFGTDISPDNFPDINLEDTPFYEMYEDDTTDVRDGLTDNNEYDEEPVIATGLDREVPTSEVNDNDVNALIILPRGNS